ncbi:hypothetical protein MHC_01460 [Mycoplasma haemocanis str. Illinois]|uniref:Uncharacterized protein n=1 Tax=Mycoplasma haemocanis (strain Illinois) TaxID=1111676 RepID=H6N686_MYCHN|nr:hypothetical protein [Mycoplasma haemocanis]AEW45158.1 hypothetical protein MHC_01460 [Mycoplasma haemocanis str. Illinois]
MLGSKAILGLAGGAVTATIGGSYFLLSDGKLFSKKKFGSFCFALRSQSGGFDSCLATFKDADEFKNYLESQGRNSHGSTAEGLDDALEKAKKAYADGLTAFVYLDSTTSSKRWVFPDQEEWRKEYLKKAK